MKLCIQKHKSTFVYGNKKIPFHFWSHTDNETPFDTVIFLGSGQNGKIPKWVAESALAGTIVVDGLPHWFAHPSARDLKEFSRDYTSTAFQAVINMFNLSAAHIIASSQAAPSAVWLAQSLPNKVRNIALITPLGFTAAVLGNTPKIRLKKLKKRTLHTLFQYSQSPFHDVRNLYIYLILLRTLLSESEQGASDNKYAAGLSYDLIEDCRIVANQQMRKGNSFTIFLGENDKIFPPQEVLTSLEKARIKHIDVVTLSETSHISLALRSSKKILDQIINILRT